ncbi:MAG: DUF739 family protein [Clostridia bacterium]|nr:DUF739 family protein [Clostridia bacterium]
MNFTELKVEILRKGFTIPSFAKAIGMAKKTLYAKLEGKSTFSQTEIVAIRNSLGLSDDRLLEIFFTQKVS